MIKIPAPNPRAPVAPLVPSRSGFFPNLYLGFFILLAITFVPTLLDPVLVPRQGLLTLFLAVAWGKLWQGGLPKGALISVVKEPLAVAYLAFLLIGAVASLQAVNGAESLYFLSRYGVEGLFLITTALLLRLGKIAWPDLVVGVTAFIGIEVVVALFQILNYLSQGKNLLIKPEYITATLANKNLLSGGLLLAIPFVVAGLRSSKRPWLQAGLLGLMVSLIWLLQTRSVWLGTGVMALAAGLFLVLRPDGKALFLGARPMLWASAGLLAILALVTALQLPQLRHLQNDQSVRERTIIWGHSIQLIQDHPLGVGLGNWPVRFPAYGLSHLPHEKLRMGERTYQRPHNDYLWVGSEAGLPGLLAYLAFLGLGLVALWKAGRQQFELGVLGAGLCGYLAFAFFDFPLERTELQILLMTLLATGIALQGKLGSTPSSIGSLLLAGVGGGILFSLAAVVGRWQGESHTRKLLLARQQGDWNKVIREADAARGSFYTVDNTTVPLDWYAGLAYFTQGDVVRARTAFEAAREAHPSHLHTLTNLASCLEKQGDHAGAIRLYREALVISPRFPDALMNMAAAQFNAGQPDSAMATLLRPGLDREGARYQHFVQVIQARLGQGGTKPR